MIIKEKTFPFFIGTLSHLKLIKTLYVYQESLDHVFFDSYFDDFKFLVHLFEGLDD